MKAATEQYVYCNPFMQVSEIGLTSHEIYSYSYGGQHNNVLEFDILWLSGAVPCPLCMLVNIKQFE